MRRKDIYNLLLLVAVLFATSCKEDVDSNWIQTDEMTISQWLSTEENMSMTAEALKSSGLFDRLGVRGSFTLFAPTNEALEAYYAAHSDVKDNPEKIKQLMNYHLIANDYREDDLSEGGFLRDTTLHGGRVAVNLFETELIVNGRARIVSLDNEMINGVIHVVDEVLDSPDQTLYEVIANDAGYSLFAAAVDQNSELKEYLNTSDVDSIPPATILAVSNDLFSQEGVSNLDELKAFAVTQFEEEGVEITPEDALNRYTNYHVLPRGGANEDGYLFLSEVEGNAFKSSSAELDYLTLTTSIEGDVLVNDLPGTDELDAIEGVSLDMERSNYLHANGVLHNVTGVVKVASDESLTARNVQIDIVKEFEEGYYYDYDEVALKYDRGFYENAGVTWEGLELRGTWTKQDDKGVIFENKSNTPGWVEYTLENIKPGTTYALDYKGVPYSYSYVFVYLYPEDETDLFEADHYRYKLKDGAEEISIHAEKGKFEYAGNPKKYLYKQEMTSTTYKIRFEVRGRNQFRPDKVVLIPQD
ncbi:fasciclin domain-containing protein [Puteibacter caeruleilacunae]|nr:fasciclin domain-containing protein [Puteibacter caeruleilacunae]